MLKILIFCVFLATTTASKFLTNEQVNVQFISKTKLENLLDENPKALQMLKQKKNSHYGITSSELITYTIGSGRINGDSRVAYESQNYSWLNPQDVKLTITYPQSGNSGAVVTYVEITVNQSNDSGRAFIINGGIGFRYITIVVEASSTYWFNYVFSIYGK